MNANHAPLSISVIARKGGVGKSMCTTLFARVFADSGLRVLVVDLDPQATTTKALLSRDSVQALDIEASSSAFANGDDLTTFVVPTAQQGLRLLPSGEPLELASDRLRLDPLALSTIQSALASLAYAHTDLVLIDTPPDYGSLTLGALASAHWAVVVSECKHESVQEVPQALKTIAKVKSVNPTLELLGVVANKLDKRRSEELSALATLRSAFPAELVEPPITDATEVNKAMKPVESVDFRANGLPAVLDVAEALIARHADASRKMAHAG